MGILDWMEQRRREKEIQRSIEARQGKVRIKRHVANQRRAAEQLREFMKRALRLGNEKQFNVSAVQYLWTLEDIRRWENNLLVLESIEARRDQVRATAEFLGSIQAMSKSILASANPAAMAKTQQELELAIARAQSFEQMLDVMMEMTEESVFAMGDFEEENVDEAIKALEKELRAETTSATAGEAESDADLERRIEEGLRRIEEERRKQK